MISVVPQAFRFSDVIKALLRCCQVTALYLRVYKNINIYFAQIRVA